MWSAWLVTNRRAGPNWYEGRPPLAGFSRRSRNGVRSSRRAPRMCAGMERTSDIPARGRFSLRNSVIWTSRSNSPFARRVSIAAQSAPTSRRPWQVPTCADGRRRASTSVVPRSNGPRARRRAATPVCASRHLPGPSRRRSALSRETHAPAERRVAPAGPDHRVP